VSWGLAEWLRLRPGSSASADGAARIPWTLGALLALAHALAAFHLRHAWSHAAAQADTARQTEEALGFAVGGGVYVNYAFLALWTADAAWWWGSEATFRRRPAALDAALRVFVLFMFVNGAIVFAHGPVRTFGALVVVAVVVAWYRRRPSR
jgi:hypothetical protein